MATVISESSKAEGVAIVVVTLLFGFMLLTVGNEQFFNEPKRRAEAPCGTFSSLPLNQIPARCVTKDGGFNN